MSQDGQPAPDDSSDQHKPADGSPDDTPSPSTQSIDEFVEAEGTLTPKLEDAHLDGESSKVTTDESTPVLHEGNENGQTNGDVSPEASTLAALAKASTDVADVDEPDPNHPSFILIASLRSQITDLTSQVNVLNSKLVKSYTQIGDLEDDLHEGRTERSRLNARIDALEQDKAKWDREIAVGGWVEKTHVQAELSGLMNKVIEETKSRAEAVKAHDKLETEVENLTSSLFSEANKMVAVERYSRARAEEKTKSLEEASTVMTGLFEELQGELRGKIEKLEARDNEVASLKKRLVEAGVATDEEKVENKNAGAEVEGEGEGPGTIFSDGKTVTVDSATLAAPPLLRPSPSRQGSRSLLSSHLITPPRLNTSVAPYNEFIAFVTYLRQLRVTTLTRPPPEFSGYTPYHGAMGTRGFGPVNTPSSPSSHIAPMLSPAQLLAPHLPLTSHTSQPFIKRCIDEDSDACLRLDLAPAFNIISRRAVASAVVDGTLLIEPAYSGSPLPNANCALCGTRLDRWWTGADIASSTTKNLNQTVRKVFGSGGWSIGSFGQKSSTPPAIPSQPPSPKAVDPPTSSSFPAAPHQQIHVFRVSDAATSRYAICPTYCTPRLRAVCEFWTYVRAMERGLLLEEGFHFVGGKDVNGAILSDSRNGSSSSLNMGRSKSSLNISEKVDHVAGALPDRQVVEPLQVVIEPDTKGDEKVEEMTEEQENNEKAEKASSGGDREATEAKPTEDEKRTESKGDLEANASGTDSASNSPSTQSAHLNRPPVPKRSIARPTTPVLGQGGFAPLTEATPSSPVKATPPKLPIRPTPISPSQRIQAATGARGSDLSGTSDAIDIVGGATGWEDRCWAEVVRLKEAVFWARMAREPVVDST